MSFQSPQQEEQMLHLGTLLAQADPTVANYASIAQEVVAGLEAIAVRLREPDQREVLGESTLVELLVGIVDASTRRDSRTWAAQEQMLSQALRVAANLVADNDANRDRLTKAGYPEKVMTMLEEGSLEDTTLQFLAASLMNLTAEKPPAAASVLSQQKSLRRIIDTANSACAYDDGGASGSSGRRHVGMWLWRVADNVLDDKTPPPYSLTLNDVRLFLPPLKAFHTLAFDVEDAEEAVREELTIISHATNVLERFNAADKIDYAALLNDGDSAEVLVNFVEHGDMPSGLDTNDWEDKEELGKLLGTSKGNVARTVVAMAEGEQPAWFSEKMSSWLGQAARPDLVSCALLSYGNRARSDAAAQQLLQDPTLLPRLISLLDPSTPVIVQHALVGLLRNLSISPANKPILGAVGVLQKLVAMDPWSSQRDMLGSIQGGAVGVVKQLVREQRNAVKFLGLENGVDALSELITRTNEPPIALEATRVWVNCARAMGMPPSPTSSPQVSEAEAKAGWTTLSSPPIVSALARLLLQGARYPMLANEALLALALIASVGGARDAVARELLEVQQVQDTTTLSRSGADVLGDILAPPEGVVVAGETQVNALALVTALGDADVSTVVREKVTIAKEEGRSVGLGVDGI